jgi:hypothetical protein
MQMWTTSLCAAALALGKDAARLSRDSVFSRVRAFVVKTPRVPSDHSLASQIGLQSPHNEALSDLLTFGNELPGSPPRRFRPPPPDHARCPQPALIPVPDTPKATLEPSAPAAYPLHTRSIPAPYPLHENMARPSSGQGQGIRRIRGAGSKRRVVANNGAQRGYGSAKAHGADGWRWQITDGMGRRQPVGLLEQPAELLPNKLCRALIVDRLSS